MKGQNFGLIYFLLVIGQIILCNFTNLGPYITLTMLPAMILCMPLTVSTSMCMIAAFMTGISVDWLAEGVVGLNAAALIPVALLRKPLVRFFLGEDLITRGDSFSFRKNGIGKISMLIITSLIVFLSIYVILDGAGTRPTWFNLTRIGASLLCNWLLSLIVTNILTTDDRK